MIKGDWVKVIETFFKETSIEEILSKESSSDRCQDSSGKIGSHHFPAVQGARVFTMGDDCPDDYIITIFVKTITERDLASQFWGAYILIKPEIEVCVLKDGDDVYFIPWDEILVIKVSDQSYL